MKNLILLFAIISNAAFGQQRPVYYDSEVYIKLKATAYKFEVNTTTNAVEISKEIPQLLLSKIATESVVRPFYFTKDIKSQGVYQVKLQKVAQLDAFIEEMKKNKDVEYIEKIPIMYADVLPNDPAVGTTNNYNLEKIEAYAAHALAVPKFIVPVAVVDIAFAVEHPDLYLNMLQGYDVSTDNDHDPRPSANNREHGTHVAGIVSGVSNNGIGIAAVGNNVVKVIPIKTTKNTTNTNVLENAYGGIIFGIEAGAKVINCSFGGSGYSQTNQNIINYAEAQGVLIVASAGNNNTETIQYPAGYNFVLSVASTDTDDVKSNFSTFGTWVNISAPGSGIYSTVAAGFGYASLSGTSMASPLVAGACGYLLTLKNDLTPAQLRSIITTTTDNLDTLNPTYINKLGTGRMNLRKAVEAVLLLN